MRARHHRVARQRLEREAERLRDEPGDALPVSYRGLPSGNRDGRSRTCVPPCTRNAWRTVAQLIRGGVSTRWFRLGLPTFGRREMKKALVLAAALAACGTAQAAGVGVRI